MADPLSIAASVLAIATAGYKTSVSLYTLAETVSTASQRVESIASDVGSTVSILNQLRDLISPEHEPNGTRTTIFTPSFFRDISTAIKHCQHVFKQIHRYLQRATKQIKAQSITPTTKIQLSASEKAKWPFLQPQFTELRNDLRDSKSNLLLMVTVAHLAITMKGGRRRDVNEEEEAELRTTIIRLQRAGTAEVQSIVSELSEEEVSRMKKLFRTVRGLRLSKEGKETPKPPTRNLKTRLDDGTRDKVVPRIEASSKLQEMLEGERLPVASGSRRKTQANTSKRVMSRDRVSSDSTVQQTQPKAAIPDPDTVLEKRSSNHKEILDHGVGHAISMKDKPVELPAERVTEIPEDRPDSQLSVNVPGIVTTTGMGSTTTSAELVASTLPPVMNDKRIEAETSRMSASPEPPPPSRPTLLASSDATVQTIPMFDPSGYTKELAHLVMEELKTALAEHDGQEETAGDVEKQREEEPMHAFTSNHFNTLNADILPLMISEADIQSLIDSRSGEDYSLLEALSKLNTMQRRLILRNVEKQGLTLCFVDTWAKESVTSFFGDLEFTLVVWVAKGHLRSGPPPPAAAGASGSMPGAFQQSMPQQQVSHPRGDAGRPAPPPGAVPGPHMGQSQHFHQRPPVGFMQGNAPPPPPPPGGGHHGPPPPPPPPGGFSGLPPPPGGHPLHGGAMPGSFPGPMPMHGMQPPIQVVSPYSRTASRRTKGRHSAGFDSSSSDAAWDSEDSVPPRATQGRREAVKRTRGESDTVFDDLLAKWAW